MNLQIRGRSGPIHVGWTLLLALLFSLQSASAQLPGDPGWVFDTSRFDSRIPAMREWAKAGVRGGIPLRNSLTVRQRLSASGNNADRAGDIQRAIDAASRAGGGVVVLRNGTYYVRKRINFKNNVVLRGESRRGVQIYSEHRYQGPREAVKTCTFNFDGVRRAGMEDLRVRYRVYSRGKEAYPLDNNWTFNTFFEYSLRSQNYQNERVYYDRAGFKYETQRNLDVDFVHLDKAEDCWIDNCEFRNSGSNGIRISGGRHHTIRRTNVTGAFQKGSNGHGYGINCSARWVLMTLNRVERVRHWAIQQGAQYCVVWDNFSGTDMNFHQGDGGSNLIENTEIKLPRFHLWKIFQTGATFHDDPGSNNMFYRNDAKRGDNPPAYTDRNKIYTFIGRDIKELPSGISPRHGKLYAMRRGGGTSTPPPSNNGRLAINSKIAIKGNNGRYVSSENGGKAMTCNRTRIGGWEVFTVVDGGGGTIALRGSNGRYVSSEAGRNPIICDRTRIGSYERFTYTISGNGVISFKSSNNRYISSENGSKAMTANRTRPGTWERFTYTVR